MIKTQRMLYTHYRVALSDTERDAVVPQFPQYHVDLIFSVG